MGGSDFTRTQLVPTPGFLPLAKGKWSQLAPLMVEKAGFPWVPYLIQCLFEPSKASQITGVDQSGIVIQLGWAVERGLAIDGSRQQKYHKEQHNRGAETAGR